MRLINVDTLEIEEFVGTDIPPYAILSHTWGHEEVSFQDWQDVSRASRMEGFAKIQGACQQARREELKYVWVDTNCIDKTSSAELSEAINSMYGWYRDASRCYVYLADTPDIAARTNSDGEVEKTDVFRRSKWFTRGWTLQELLAPRDVIFYSVNWVEIGTKIDLKTTLSQISGIESKYLTGSVPIWMASVAKRMSWMSKRVTTRIEDIAYCMLGLFEINMPLLYGEGPRAFLRLQEEILKVTDDQSIFCWEWKRNTVADDWASILAPCPAVFRYSGEFSPTAWIDDSEVVPYNVTNAGLSIRLPFVQTANSSFVCAVLQVRQEWVHGNGDTDFPYSQQVCIPLEKTRIHRRLPYPTKPFPLHMSMAGPEKNIYIVSRSRGPETSRGYISTASELSKLFTIPNFDVGFMLTFQPTDYGPFLTEVAFCTPGVEFIEKKSLLGFSLEDTNTAGKFAAVILSVTHFGPKTFMILLAVRLQEAADGTHKYKFYCQIIPQPVIDRAVACGLQLSDIVREVESKSMHVAHDIDFSSDGDATVALGNVIHYASSGGGHRQFVKVVNIVSGDLHKSDALKEETDSSISFFIP